MFSKNGSKAVNGDLFRWYWVIAFEIDLEITFKEFQLSLLFLLYKGKRPPDQFSVLTKVASGR